MKLVYTVFFIILTGCSFFTKEQPLAFNSEKAQNAPYVILISIDGLRHDYIDYFKPPTLLSLKTKGLSTNSLQPVFPSKTFPNHYSIITGMHAETHGLISNSFYSPSLRRTYKIGSQEVTNGEWYGGEPLWVTAKKNNMVSASYFWVGSEAKIQGSRPDYYFQYNGRIPGEERVDQVIKWLNLPSKKRPHFITLYFSKVDSAGHKYGPLSKEVKDALFDVDDSIHRLVTKLKKTHLPVNIIIVSDHGMTKISNEKKIVLPESITKNKNIRVVGKGSLSLLYIKDQNEKSKAMRELKEIPHLNIYEKRNMPKRFYFQNNERIPEITLSPNLPYYIASVDKQIKGGTHGYDPQEKDMHGVFFAIGPNIKPGKIQSIANIHIYPFITSLLNIKPNEHIDGKKEVLERFIR